MQLNLISMPQDTSDSIFEASFVTLGINSAYAFQLNLSQILSPDSLHCDFWRQFHHYFWYKPWMHNVTRHLALKFSRLIKFKSVSLLWDKRYSFCLKVTSLQRYLDFSDFVSEDNLITSRTNFVHTTYYSSLFFSRSERRTQVLLHIRSSNDLQLWSK